MSRPYFIFAKRSTAVVKFSIVLSASPHTVTDMSFKHHLAYFMERRACGTYLGQHILAWLILIHHPVHSLQLSHNFTDSLMKILAVHTFFHTLSPFTK